LFAVGFGLALVLVLSSHAQAARTIHVPRDLPTIQEAINEASQGDTVLVAPGTYKVRLDFKEKHVILRSAEGPERTILTAGQHKIVQMGPMGVLDGFTLTGSKGAAVGVRRKGSIIEDCIFERNGSDNGQFPTCIEGLASPTIRRNIFRHNASSERYGSCVIGFSNGSSPLVQNNLFHDNKSLVISFALPSRTKAIAVNNTIVNNDAGIIGGFYVANNIIVGNKKGLARHSNMPEQWVSENNVIFNNEVDIYEDRAVGTGTVRGTLAIDPRFVDPDNGDFRLRQDSPLIDRGLTRYLGETDLAGNPRSAPRKVGDPAVADIGAYEYVPKGYTPTLAEQNDSPGYLVLVRASYGRGSVWVDAKPRIEMASTQAGFHILVDRGLVQGPDPVPGKPKSLSLHYRIGPREYHRSYPEGHKVSLKSPVSSQIDLLIQKHPSALHIVEAYYGAGADVADRTQWLRQVVSSGTANFTVSPETVYADPAPGRKKLMTVAYLSGGAFHTAFAYDGEMLVLIPGPAHEQKAENHEGASPFVTAEQQLDAPETIADAVTTARDDVPQAIEMTQAVDQLEEDKGVFSALPNGVMLIAGGALALVVVCVLVLGLFIVLLDRRAKRSEAVS
jgi:hypothetical protein